VSAVAGLRICVDGGREGVLLSCQEGSCCMYGLALGLAPLHAATCSKAFQLRLPWLLTPGSDSHLLAHLKRTLWRTLTLFLLPLCPALLQVRHPPRPEAAR
jgi:hypothetical protein